MFYEFVTRGGDSHENSFRVKYLRRMSGSYSVILELIKSNLNNIDYCKKLLNGSNGLLQLFLPSYNICIHKTRAGKRKTNLSFEFLMVGCCSRLFWWRRRNNHSHIIKLKLPRKNKQTSSKQQALGGGYSNSPTH